MDNYFSARDILDKAIGTDAYFQIRSILYGLKAADVVEVRHGHWINIPPYECTAGYKKGQECSECNAYYVSDGSTPWSNHKYCAECGAKMDGEIEWENRVV